MPPSTLSQAQTTYQPPPVVPMKESKLPGHPLSRQGQHRMQDIHRTGEEIMGVPILFRTFSVTCAPGSSL